MSLFAILATLAGAVVVYIIFTFNVLVTLRNRVKEAWSDIEVQMKRRYDLIPNLIETVRGYTKHEADTLRQVTEARTQAMNNHGLPADVAKTENVLAATLKSLFAVAENYPDLKANQNYLELQQELTDTEDKIQSSRRFYNGNVMTFNTKIEQFPSNVVARGFGFTAQSFFELEADEAAAAKKPVKVSF